MSEPLSLSEAIKSGQLPEFIAQQEAAGVGPIDRAEFDAAMGAIVKAPRSKDRTSRSSSAGNSNGKKTRRGSGQGASD
jgi:hypothetical protein